MRYIAAMGAAWALMATPVLAAERPSNAPVKLADQDLDQVAAGDGSLLNLNVNLNVLLQDIRVGVNISNVPVNAAVAVQANAIGQAIQNATVLAGQQVTQVQGTPTLP